MHWLTILNFFRIFVNTPWNEQMTRGFTVCLSNGRGFISSQNDTPGWSTVIRIGHLWCDDNAVHLKLYMNALSLRIGQATQQVSHNVLIQFYVAFAWSRKFNVRSCRSFPFIGCKWRVHSTFYKRLSWIIPFVNPADPFIFWLRIFHRWFDIGNL